MKCFRHQHNNASAICLHCGAGVCADCAQRTASLRIVCSPECAAALAEAESLLAGIRRKTLGGHRLTGYFCCGAAAVLVLFALLAGLEQQWPVFALQMLLAIGLGGSGFFYLRLSNRNE